MDFIAKLLFPGMAPWQQRKNLKMGLWALAIGMVTGIAIVGIIWLQNRKLG